MKIIDLTDYSLHPLQGRQAYSRKELQALLNTKQLRKEFKIVVVKRPWYFPEDEWKGPLYQIIRR